MKSKIADVRAALAARIPELASRLEALERVVGDDLITDADRRRIAVELLTEAGVSLDGLVLEFGWRAWSRRLTIRVRRKSRADDSAPLRAIGENETPLPAEHR